MFRRVARAEAADPDMSARALGDPALAGRLDPAHTEIYEKLEADIAHRRAVAGLEET
jgi:hypothetical protein